MFDTSWIADLDADQACVAITATQDVLREKEWHELRLAGHWAVLHDPDSPTPSRPQSTGAAGGAATTPPPPPPPAANRPGRPGRPGRASRVSGVENAPCTPVVRGPRRSP